MTPGSITAIWRALGGGPLHYHRGRAFWRKGDGWNIALDEEKGVWYDFAANEGGGLIDLVQRARGCDAATAAAWLCAFAGIPPESHTAEERKSFARHRREAKREAQLCARWALGLRMHLERAKRAAFDGGKWFLWQRACRRLFLLESSDALTLQAWCNQARERDLKRWQAFVRDGERDMLFNETLCALIVDWLTEVRCRQGKAA